MLFAIVPVWGTSWLLEFEPSSAAETGTLAPFTLPTVVASDPAEFVTSPVSAGIAAVGSVVVGVTAFEVEANTAS